jgi:hypothetical protein
VKDLWVEVRVGPAGPELAARFDESDVMLDPWFELPTPPVTGHHRPKLTEPPLPDIPEIPSDEEQTSQRSARPRHFFNRKIPTIGETQYAIA